jgi:hypothetical protein
MARFKRPTVGLLLLVLAVTILGNPFGITMPHWVVQLALLPILLAVVAGIAYRQRIQGLIRKHKPRDIPAVPESHASTLQYYASKRRSEQDFLRARIFALGILRPEQLIQRIVDEYEAGRRSLSQRESIEVQIPRRLLEMPTKKGRRKAIEPPRTIWFPMLIDPKGTLHDNLDFQDEHGDGTHSLSYREYLELAATVLRDLLLAAYRQVTDAEESLPAVALEAEREALVAIFQRRTALPSTSSEAADRIEHLPGGNPVWLRFAADFVEKLTVHYATVVPVHPSETGRFSVTSTQTIIPRMRLSTRRVRAFFETALGARPVDVTIPVATAGRCQSYHLRMAGPAGTYLGKQELIGSEHVLATKAYDAPTSPYFRFRRRLGQPYAHFYTRFFPPVEANGTKPEVRLTFLETPPGSIFRAAATAMVTAALIWLVGVLAFPGGQAASDVPAFLLVFPAAAAAWLGIEAPTGRLFEGTLASRLHLLLTAIVSIAASGLFMVYKRKLTGFHVQLPYHISILGVRQWPWAVLVVAAILDAAVAIYQCGMDVWAFNHLSSREHDGAAEEHA